MEDRLGNHEEARQIFERGILAAGSRANYERRVWSEMESPVNTDPMLKAWADMEQRLGHISPAPEWNVYRGSQRDTKARERRRATIGERLVMLRKLVDRRSEEDLRAVLAFIAERTLIDRRARAAMSERSREDLERLRRWAERRNEEDILAFKKWFEKRYEEDRLVGHYVFGWNLELYSSERELHLLPAVAWISSFAENLSSRAALSTLLIGLLMALSAGFTHIYELGRNEIGNVESALLQILSTPAPQGVDAHLIDPRPSALDDRYES
ncbi:hypothetical protein F1559_004471 [Cyanidiococcus yangmingshanensis]|uniref:Uncharacterized protein n=1 Tax=Cyanidiococcus yangmingshanensis TaxID=2690220 RepID=A0A7J7IN41_9RHOD|nr:hypothetical protein F1559_004471 [Cyanidiococcus yangmingshanensis]